MSSFSANSAAHAAHAAQDDHSDPLTFTVHGSNPSSTSSKPSTQIMLSVLVTTIAIVLSCFDNSGSMYMWAGFLEGAIQEDSKKTRLFGHFSHIASHTQSLPPSGLTDLTIPFERIHTAVDEAVQTLLDKLLIQIISDGGHNWTEMKDMLMKSFYALKYAREKNVTLVFTIIMVGDYIRCNCWVSILALFCKMMGHQCHIVYKRTRDTIAKINEAKDGSTSCTEVPDDKCMNGNNPFRTFVKDDNFFDLSECKTAWCYAYAFLKSSECNGLPKEIRASVEAFWKTTLSAYDAPSEKPAVVFTYPAKPTSLEELKTMIARYFTAPPRILVDSKIGMQSLADYFSVKLAESGSLFLSFEEMVATSCHEKWLNTRLVSAMLPYDEMTAASMSNPIIAKFLEKLVNLSTINVQFYNAVNEFIIVYFAKLHTIEAVSIIESRMVYSTNFYIAMIDLIKSKRAFFPRMTIGSSKREQDAYAKFLTGINTYCMVSPMKQEDETGGLKHPIHLILHNLFCQTVNAGITGCDKLNTIKIALQFDCPNGFLENLKKLDTIKRYLKTLYENILKDHKLPAGIPQSTEVAKYQNLHSAFMMEILILLNMMNGDQNFQKFCESFKDMHAKMKCGGDPDCNPERNWKTGMECQNPVYLAFAVVLAMHPDDFEDYIGTHPEHQLKQVMITGVRQVTERCPTCVGKTQTVQKYVVEPLLDWRDRPVFDWMGRPTTREKILSAHNQHMYREEIIKTRTISTGVDIKDVPKCADCVKKVPYEFPVFTDDLLSNIHFIHWLTTCMSMRNLDKLITVMKDGKPTGEADSPLTEIYKIFQKGEVKYNYQVVYFLRKAFRETEYVMSTFEELIEVIENPATKAYFFVDPFKFDAGYSWGMIQHMKDMLPIEMTKGAVQWMKVLAKYSEHFKKVRIQIAKIHAVAPIHTHGMTVHCNVCGFRVKEPTISDHEAATLSIKLPYGLLTLFAILQSNGKLVLGTINDAIDKRKTSKKFQDNYQDFIMSFQRGAFLEKWYEFGSQKRSICSIMEYRASTHYFMLAIQLQEGTTIICRFSSTGELLKVFNLDDITFKRDDLSDYPASFVQMIESGVRALLRE